MKDPRDYIKIEEKNIYTRQIGNNINPIFYLVIGMCIEILIFM